MRCFHTCGADYLVENVETVTPLWNPTKKKDYYSVCSRCLLTGPRADTPGEANTQFWEEEYERRKKEYSDVVAEGGFEGWTIRVHDCLPPRTLMVSQDVWDQLRKHVDKN